MSQNPNNITYLSNPNLRRANVVYEYTREQIEEIQRCRTDPQYFISKWVQIITLDEGRVTFSPFKFQREMIDTFHGNRFSICKMPRQSGKSTTVVAYFLWVVLFQSDQNIAIVANRGDLARTLLAKVKLAYEYLPIWLQQGVIEWNKGNILLENNSKILATASVRGESYNILFVDEFAHINNTQADAFFNAAYPTISSGKHSKIILVSTPNGLNHFYKQWTNAEQGKNLFKTISVHWSDVPGRDEKWKEQEIANTSKEQFLQEQECEFLGSANTLINPTILRSLVFHDPFKEVNGFRAYKQPELKRTYVIVADTAHGVGNDDSAFVIIDVSDHPYEVVATYNSNEISPLYYPEVIYSAAKQYNDAFVLCELNDVGAQVAHILTTELEYENILMTQQKGRAGMQLTYSYSKKTELGVRTTVQVKKVGCANIKAIIEQQQLVIKDFTIIEQLSNFIKRKNSYEAAEGCKDDLVMCLVLFGWLSKQEIFKELTNTDFRAQLIRENEEKIRQEMLPLPIFAHEMKEPDKAPEHLYRQFAPPQDFDNYIGMDFDDPPDHFF